MENLRDEIEEIIEEPIDIQVIDDKITWYENWGIRFNSKIF